LGRPAWDDEIDQACLKAFEIMGDQGRLPDIERFTANENSDHLQLAALAAWASCAPDDPRLHQVLMDRAESGKYGVQWYSIGALGDLLVEEGRPILEKLAMESGDNDMRIRAEEVFLQIKKVVELKRN